MGRRFFLRGVASLPFVGVAFAVPTASPQRIVVNGPVFATGGVIPKAVGRLMLVGERGPEMIVPRG